MKLGFGMGYWGAAPSPDAQELVLEAERLGYDSIWTAEAYGSDALTPLAWYGSRTAQGEAGNVDHPDVGTDPGGYGDGGDHHGSPLAGPLHPGAGSVWSPGR